MSEINRNLQYLTLFLSHSIDHIELEIQSLNRLALKLEKTSRERIIDRYGKQQAWRGLASDSFIGMVDALVPLGLSDTGALK